MADESACPALTAVSVDGGYDLSVEPTNRHNQMKQFANDDDHQQYHDPAPRLTRYRQTRAQRAADEAAERHEAAHRPVDALVSHEHERRGEGHRQRGEVPDRIGFDKIVSA